MRPAEGLVVDLFQLLACAALARLCQERPLRVDAASQGDACGAGQMHVALLACVDGALAQLDGDQVVGCEAQHAQHGAAHRPQFGAVASVEAVERDFDARDFDHDSAHLAAASPATMPLFQAQPRL